VLSSEVYSPARGSAIGPQDGRKSVKVEYEKAGLTCHVTVFLMQVTEVASQWPEEEVRQRVYPAGTEDRRGNPGGSSGGALGPLL
jgi:hypothetical protein